jgi:hypothetical protein
MEARLRPLRNRIRRRFAYINGLFGKLAATLGPPTAEVRLQRMCPVLRLDNVTPQDLLPGMRPVAEARLVSDP